MSFQSRQSTHTVVEALKRVTTFENCGVMPELLETHISHLFLLKDVVYKLKKPVDLGFLDFSNVEQRRAACETELQINRRLAEDVYLDFLPVGPGRDGQWRIGGDAAPTDWVVKMRRLPRERCFAHLLETGDWTERDIAAIIERLSKFYRTAEAVQPDDYVDSVTQHVTHNQSELVDPRHSLRIDTVNQIHSAQLQFLFWNRRLLDNRVSQGRIIDGHGDLRAEHLYLTDPPAVIDGIEFDHQLRFVDIADELGFLSVTCDAVDAHAIGERILLGVLGDVEDHPDSRLLDFYRCYRACVRAKVHAVRSDQTTDDAKSKSLTQAKNYLRIAFHYATRLMTPPLVIIVRGFSGTGKTTLARALATQLAVPHLSTDSIRRTFAQNATSSRPLYNQKARDEVYDHCFATASEHVALGPGVILDGTFLTSDLLNRAIDSISQVKADVCVVTCSCPAEVALSRIRNRIRSGESNSDANERVFQQQQLKVDSPAANIPHVKIDTTQDIEAQLEQLRHQRIR